MSRLKKGLLTGAACSLTGILIALMPLGIWMEHDLGLTWLYKLRGPADPPANVAIVAIDERTGEHLGLPSLPREWPRSIHARLIDRLVELGAAAIVFDIDFERPKNPDDDALLQKAIVAADRVVLVEKLTGKKQPVADRNGKETVVWIEQLIRPLAAFADAATGLAPFPVPKTEAAVYDFWAFKPSIGDVATMPVMAMQVLARTAHEELVRLLGTLGTAPDVTANNKDLQLLVRTVRQTYIKNPQMVTAMERVLASAQVQALPEKRREQLQILHNLYRGPDHRHLNFYGPPGTLRTLPYHSILAATDPKAASPMPDLANKVVFVGFSDLYSPGQIDRFLTVYSTADGVDLSGVEIAATAFANISAMQSLQILGPQTTFLLLGVIGVVLGMLIYALPASRGVPLALTLAGLYLYAAYCSFAYHNFWLPLAVPMIVQLPLALFLGLMGQYLLERAEKERATKAVSYYLPEHIAADFAQGRVDASALNKVVYGTCLASDMVGFTVIAEQKDPTELAAFLNDYFDTVSRPLKQHGVDVTEFRADGIMCAWTAPEPAVDVRRKAIAAALDTVLAVSQFKERHALGWQPLRIGLEAGTIFVGHAGGGGRFVYSIVGDSANTAARVEALNKHLATRLLATASVVAGIPDLLVRPVGDFHFVGKSEPLTIVEILAWRAEAMPRDIELAERFATAMDLLQSGAIAAANEALRLLEADYPGDGPCRYHLARCAQVPAGEFNYVVKLQQK